MGHLCRHAGSEREKEITLLLLRRHGGVAWQRQEASRADPDMVQQLLSVSAVDADVVTGLISHFASYPKFTASRHRNNGATSK